MAADRGSLVWLLATSTWFLQHLPEANGPGIASVYLQCIAELKAVRDNCKARAEWFSQEELAELEAAWVWAALLSILVGWLLAYIIVWILRWIRRGFQPSTLGYSDPAGVQSS